MRLSRPPRWLLGAIARRVPVGSLAIAILLLSIGCARARREIRPQRGWASTSRVAFDTSALKEQLPHLSSCRRDQAELLTDPWAPNDSELARIDSVVEVRVRQLGRATGAGPAFHRQYFGLRLNGLRAVLVFGIHDQYFDAALRADGIGEQVRENWQR